jgi:molecular chaperone DnaK (HSP70)
MSDFTTRRWKSDVGDVIGIDLGTTNSCVSIMVRLTVQNIMIMMMYPLLKPAT